MLFDRSGGLPSLVLQLPVPPRETLPREVYDTALRRLIHYPSALVAATRPPETQGCPSYFRCCPTGPWRSTPPRP